MHRAALLGAALSVLAVGLAACGGGETKVEVPDNTEPAPMAGGPGQDCIKKANPGGDVPADAPRTISVSHVVVNHIDVATAPDSVTRSREDACLRALEALDKLKGGAEFGAVVTEYSDGSGAKANGGSLGTVKADDLQPSFAAAAFALDIGQVSYVVESKFGFHIIQRND